jgi:serine/threonine protein kinase
MPPRCRIPGSPASSTTARLRRPLGPSRPRSWSWSWLTASRCRHCWLGKGAWGLARSLDIVGQAAVAVGAAHRAGLVHRDIKPANLLVRPDGLMKVTDFGVAQALGSQAGDQHDGLLGTAGHLSPEQATGRVIRRCSATSCWRCGEAWRSWSWTPPERRAQPGTGTSGYAQALCRFQISGPPVATMPCW